MRLLSWRVNIPEGCLWAKALWGGGANLKGAPARSKNPSRDMAFSISLTPSYWLEIFPDGNNDIFWAWRFLW
jgi:hypothetical protein